MSLIDRLFGRARPAAAPASSQPHSHLATSHSHSHQSKHPTIGTRREMLRVVLRDTLNRYGIPAAWITADVLVATSRGREPGVHWRLVVRHWDPRLPVHQVAFQNHLIKRVMTFDPMAAEWLMGISWQYNLDDESACPQLPHPGVWTADPPRIRSHNDPVSPIGGSGDVIAGPVRIGEAAQAAPDPDHSSAREDLERLLAVRDADMHKHAQQGFEATQPMFARTEPAKL